MNVHGKCALFAMVLFFVVFEDISFALSMINFKSFDVPFLPFI